MLLGSLFRSTLSSRSWFDRATKGLINFLYWFLVPLTFIGTFSVRGITKDLILPFTSSTFLVIVVWALIKLTKPTRDPSIQKGILLNSTVQNNLFVGFPVLYSFYGDAFMSLYFGFVAFIFAILLPDIMGKGKPSLKIILTNPVIIGMFAGLAIHYLVAGISNVVSSALYWAPTLLSYLSIFATGISLRMNLGPIKENKGGFIATAIFKLMVNPIVNLILLQFFTLPALYRDEVILLSFMPPASFNTVMTMKYGWKPEFVASSSFFLTIASLVIVSIVYHIL